jgi:uncharacterized protein YdaU (DUF1376 family)
MAEYPALPLWTDALVADTDHLSDAEFGAYMRMLIVSWRSPKCNLPNDPAWIKRRFKEAESDWPRYLSLIEEYFTKRGCRLIQKRLKRERSFVKNSSQKQSARAKARWDKEKDACRGNASMHASGNAPTPTPTPIKKERKNAPAKRTPTGVDQTDLDALLYQRGKALLGRSAGGQITKLRAAVGLGAALEAIDQAQHKESPAEYVAGVIRAKGNGSATRQHQRASIVEAGRRVVERANRLDQERAHRERLGALEDGDGSR